MKNVATEILGRGPNSTLPGCEGVIFIYWSAVHIDDFPIFTGINSSLHGFTMNQHNDKLSWPVISVDGSRVFGKCQFIRTMRLLPPFSKMDSICTMTTARDYPFRRPVINPSNVNRFKSNYLPSIIDLLLWVKICQKSRINE